MPAETDKATAKELQRIRRLPENRVCPNCLKEESVGFGAVCTTFKTFVCHDCKSAHQGFSHRCKSVQMSIWTMDEVKALDECNGGGNASAVRCFLSRLPEKERVKQGSSPDAYKRFIERAYIKLRWAEDKLPERVEEQALKLESEDFTLPSSKKGKKRKSRKSHHAAEGNLDSPHVKPDIAQEVCWHPDAEIFQTQAAVGNGWMSHDAYSYTYPEQENYWAPHAGPHMSYPSDPPYQGSSHEEIGPYSYSGGPSLPSGGAASWQNAPGSPHASSHNEKWQTGAPSVSTASPPFSAAASWSTWSSPTVKAASLPLDPTNPWAEDVLPLRFESSHGWSQHSRAKLGRNCYVVVPTQTRGGALHELNAARQAACQLKGCVVTRRGLLQMYVYIYIYYTHTFLPYTYTSLLKTLMRIISLHLGRLFLVDVQSTSPAKHPL